MSRDVDGLCVMYESDAAAHRATVTGWVDRHGRFFGDDEHLARWSGSTHKTCDCGQVMPKNYSRCMACSDKRRVEKYEAMPLVEWDGETPFVVFDDGPYFFSLEGFLDWCVEHGANPASVRLELCSPNYLSQLEVDYWHDELPEDGELPVEVEAALTALNDVIRASGPVSWRPGGKRVTIIRDDAE